MANANNINNNNDRIATTATTHAPPPRATTPTRAHLIWQYCRRQSKRRIQAIEQRTDELDAALMQATVDGNLQRVQLLMSQGANRHVQHSAAMLESHVTYDREAFDTPLEAAAWLGHDDIVRYFLEQQQQQHEQRSSRRLLFKKRNSRRLQLEKEASSPDLVLDHEAFLVACQGGSLAAVQAFVQHYGPEIITQPCPNVVTPLHYACARCHLPLIQYLLSHDGEARLDQPAQRGGAAPIFWLGMFIEMNRTHGDEDSSPIPLPERDDLSEENYEAALAWIIQHYPAALLATDHRGTTALQRLLKRAPMGLIRTAVVHLVTGPAAPYGTQT